MDRGRAAGAAALILSSIVLLGAARADVARHLSLGPGDATTHRFEADAGTRLRIDVATEGRPVDVLVLDADGVDRWRAGRDLAGPGPGGALSAVDHGAAGTLPHGGTWTVVVDNTAAPPDGSYSDEPVDVRLTVDRARTPGSPGGPVDALAFRSAYVPVTDGFGVAGWVLWAVAVAVVALPWEKESLLAVAAVAAATVPVTVVGRAGVATHSLVPALVGTLAGLHAVRQDRSWVDVQRRTVPATLLGTLIGADLVHAAAATGPEVLVAGGAGLADALAVAPLVAAIVVSAAWIGLRGRTGARVGVADLRDAVRDRLGR